MKRVFSSTLSFVVFAGLCGCGDDKTVLPGPLTDEQKKAIKAEDEKVALEEGGGPRKNARKAAKPGK